MAEKKKEKKQYDPGQLKTEGLKSIVCFGL
jgi:hypothetical protein